MPHWLMKSEPDTYSYDDLVREKTGHWDGVRNYQARNFMRAMKRGDVALFYQSVKNPGVVGTMEIVKTAYPDSTAKDGDWSQVDVRALTKFKNFVTLAELKDIPELKNMLLFKQSRLSVMPVSDKEFEIIQKLGSGKSK